MVFGDSILYYIDKYFGNIDKYMVFLFNFIQLYEISMRKFFQEEILGCTNKTSMLEIAMQIYKLINISDA